jgi:hypothetical protein
MIVFLVLLAQPVPMYYKPILVSCCEHSIEENSLLPVSVKQGFKTESLRMIVSFLVWRFFSDNGFFGVDFNNLGSMEGVELRRTLLADQLRIARAFCLNCVLKG